LNTGQEGRKLRARADSGERMRPDGDLHYVQEVVRSSERRSAPKAIYFLWAVICLVGFTLVDFAPRRVGIFWMIAGPAGFVASAGIGWWWAAAGEDSGGKPGG
jgi:hypothetical protein